MATVYPFRRNRYLYLGGPVETARARARRLVLLATVIYATSLFGLVMLAHEWMDGPLTAVPDPPALVLHGDIQHL